MDVALRSTVERIEGGMGRGGCIFQVGRGGRGCIFQVGRGGEGVHGCQLMRRRRECVPLAESIFPLLQTA